MKDNLKENRVISSTEPSDTERDDNYVRDKLDSEGATSPTSSKKYVTTPYRWLILIVVCAATICQTMTVMTIAPVATPI